jgi:hypothetical protein
MDDASPTHSSISPDRRWRWDGSQWVPNAEPLPPHPSWLALHLRLPVDGRALLVAGVIALAVDQWLRSGSFGIGAGLTVLAAAAGLLLSGRLATRQGQVLVALATVFGLWLALRASPWLLWPDLVAAAGLLLVGAGLSSGWSVFDLSFPTAVARGLHGLVHMSAAPGFLAPLRQGLHGRLGHHAGLLRGLLLAAPVVGVLGLLLASADPIFASFFALNLNIGRLLLDVLYLAVGLWAGAGLLRFASANAIDAPGEPPRRLASEAVVVLAAVDAIFLVFAAAQVVGASGAGQATLQAAGMTYADYARSGFFELLWVAGLTLGLLLVLSGLLDRSRPSVRRLFLALALLAVGLTLMIVAVSFRRLQLYEEAYGFSMLRLYSHVFGVWIGLVFVLLAFQLAGLGHAQHWLLGAAAGLGLAGLLCLNLLNPEALVADLNLARAESNQRLDSDYLRSLSDDAVPTLTRSAAGRAAVCGGPRSYAPEWAALNLASQQAADSRRRSC